MRFFYDNLIDYSGVGITTTSDTTALPVTNVANPLRKRIYRSGGAAVVDIVFDLGSAKTPTSLIILDNTFRSDDLISVFASASAGFGTFDTIFSGQAATAGETFLKTFTPSTARRYWMIHIVRSVSQSFDIGRVFLGTYYETTEPPDYDGFGRTRIDPSKSQRSAGGQEYTDIREHYQELKTKFTDCPGSQISSFSTVFESRGMHTPFFIQIDPTLLTTVYYVKFAADFKRDVKAFDSDFYWDTTLQFREQL